MSGNFSRTLKTKLIEDFITDVSNTSTSYYIGFGKYSAWDDDQNPPATNNSLQSYSIDVQKNLLFGKKISPTDISFVIKNVNWQQNTVYTQYDNTDPYLFDNNFYVINEYNRVYKCLYNNGGLESTVMPQGNNPIGDFDTADGYKWKYLYTLSSFDRKKYSSVDYVVVNNDSSVVSQAESGAIHVCMVTNGGQGYLSANGNIDNSISNTLFKISNNVGSILSGAYTGSTIYGGGAPYESAAIVTDYVVNASGKFVVTNTPITNFVGGSFIICPKVTFNGDGSGAFAITEVDADGAITSIKMIGRGQDYNYADISFEANSYYGSGATGYSIISPKGGHGANNVVELGCDSFGISIETNSTDNFYNWITYRQASLLYNPKATSNNELYYGSSFNQITSLNLVSFTGVMGEGEIITGALSGATATVIYMDASKIYLTNVVGSFNEYETVSGYFTGENATISTINSQDIIPYSADVLYYKNFEPISRNGIRSEQIKVYFKL